MTEGRIKLTFAGRELRWLDESDAVDSEQLTPNMVVEVSRIGMAKNNPSPWVASAGGLHDKEGLDPQVALNRLEQSLREDLKRLQFFLRSDKEASDGPLSVSVLDGKYTFQQEPGDWRIHVYRHGAPWLIIEQGHKAVLALMSELVAARQPDESAVVAWEIEDAGPEGGTRWEEDRTTAEEIARDHGQDFITPMYLGTPVAVED